MIKISFGTVVPLLNILFFIMARKLSPRQIEKLRLQQEYQSIYKIAPKPRLRIVNLQRSINQYHNGIARAQALKP